jgi:hypothetical protein
VQTCINSLDHYQENDFITEQLFVILEGLVRKCYQMDRPQELFDHVMSAYIFFPLLIFTFSGSQSSKQGLEFLKVLLFNMFIAEPSEAHQDVMEINFGFQITSIAGMSTEEFQHKQATEGESKGDASMDGNTSSQ